MRGPRGPDVAAPGWSSATSPGTSRAANGPSLARVAGLAQRRQRLRSLGEEGLLASAGFFPSITGGLFLHTFVYYPKKLITVIVLLCVAYFL